MNPLRVQARGFRSYDELDLELPTGTCAITGSNGSGKSSLISIVDLGLFGPESRTLADYVTDDQDELELTLTFEHQGEVYRVRRGFSAKGRGRSTLDFELSVQSIPREYEIGDRVNLGNGETWRPLTQATAKETQAEIERVLGLSRKTWRASAFLAQGEGDSFTSADPRDRKSILAEVLALDVWDELLELARGDRRTAEQELERLAGQTQMLQEQADQRPAAEHEAAYAAEAVTRAAVPLNVAERHLTEIAAKVRDAETASATRKAAEAELARARAEHGRLQEIQTEAVRCAEDETDSVAALGDLATVDQVIALESEHRTLRDAKAAETLAVQEYKARERELGLKIVQRNAILGQASEMNEKAHAIREEADRLEAAGPGENTCDHCGQTLGAEALAASLLKMRAEADELDAGARDRDQQANTIVLPDLDGPPRTDEQMHEKLSALEERLTNARRDQEQRSRLHERVAILDERIALAAGDDFKASLYAAGETLKDAEAVLSELGQPVDVDTLRAEALTADAHVRNARQALDDARQRKTLADAALARVVEAEAKLAETADRREQLQQDVDLALDLEKAYGRDGIPALIVESQAIPTIETDANRILSDLGTPYRVELRTQRELKSGDGLRDTLDVVVITDAGARAYETFSGGERTRLNLALRIALAKLLANRRGAESRLLAIDEPDGLDSDGFARLAEVLAQEADTFERVLVISHHPDLVGAFDSTIAVEKVDGRSVIHA